MVKFLIKIRYYEYKNQELGFRENDGVLDKKKAISKRLIIDEVEDMFDEFVNVVDIVFSKYLRGRSIGFQSSKENHSENFQMLFVQSNGARKDIETNCNFCECMNLAKSHFIDKKSNNSNIKSIDEVLEKNASLIIPCEIELIELNIEKRGKEELIDKRLPLTSINGDRTKIEIETSDNLSEMLSKDVLEKIEQKVEKYRKELLKAESRKQKQKGKNLKKELKQFKQTKKMLARFIEHVTIPDGSVLQPNTRYQKIWKFRNESNRPWKPSSYIITAGKVDSQLIFDSNKFRVTNQNESILPGGEVCVKVDFLTPSTAGKYSSFWRLWNETDEKFGQRFWIKVNVSNE